MVYIGAMYIPIIGAIDIEKPSDEPPSTMLVLEGISLASVSSIYYIDPDLLVLRYKIIQCESGGNPLAQNSKSTRRVRFKDSSNTRKR